VDFDYLSKSAGLLSPREDRSIHDAEPVELVFSFDKDSAGIMIWVPNELFAGGAGNGIH
jgi:hypothetical protein